MCIYHMCFSKELQVVCNEKFHIHRSFMSAVLGEMTANHIWLLAEELKELQLSKYQIPVVWAITLLNPGKLD